jgi:alkaline phosphatase
MKKRGVSAVIATVLLILITIAVVGIMWAFVLPLLKDIFIETRTVNLQILDEGYTKWDKGNKLAEVQVMRGNDGAVIIGYDLIFLFEDGSSVTHSVKENLSKNTKTIVYVNLSGYNSELDIIKIVPVYEDEKRGPVVNEIKLKSSNFFNLGSSTKIYVNVNKGEYIPCIATNTTYFYRCFGNNVYWYDNCNIKTNIKEQCSYECSGSECITCTPNCAGKDCGDNGCGGSCGTCQTGQTCTSGLCQATCIPNCTGKDCGSNGCGGICGTCQTGQTCVGGLCQVGCIANCTGKDCGSNGCGGSCGTCQTGQTCIGGLCENETQNCIDNDPNNNIYTKSNVIINGTIYEDYCVQGTTETGIKNIIIFIGDGMGPEHQKAASMYSTGSENKLFFEASFPYKTSVTTRSANNPTTDSAAAGTAIATGYKVNNGVVSMAIPGDGRNLETLLEYYKASGKSVGFVTTSYMTDATPATFAAHETSRSNYAQIANDYLTGSKPNVLLGGGGSGISTTTFSSSGYTVVTSLSGLNSINTENTNFLLGNFGSSSMPYEYDGLGSLPHLTNMTTKALNILDNDPDGLFLMVEGGLIDHAGHENNIRKNVQETIEFDRAIQAAYNWAAGRTDTLIIVTADHETGGLKVLSNNGINNYPTVSWSTGDHTGVNVNVYSWGAGAVDIASITDNTGFFNAVTSIKKAGGTSDSTCERICTVSGAGCLFKTCTKGCIDGHCITETCISNSFYSCYNNNVYWYDSCNVRENIKEQCSYGCTGNTCNVCTPNCAGKNCGDNGCGGICGTCQTGQTCISGVCQASGVGSIAVTFQQLKDDTTLLHEMSPLPIIPTSWGWSSHGNPYQSACGPRNFPNDGKNYFNPWGQIFPDPSTPENLNAGFEIGQITFYIKLKSTGRWYTYEHGELNDGYIFYGQSALPQVPGTSYSPTRGPGGGLFFKLGMGNWKQGTGLHNWPSHSWEFIQNNDVEQAAISITARIVLQNPTGVDDRNKAKYLIGIGVDHRFQSGNGAIIEGVMMSRHRYITNEWQTFTMSTICPDKVEIEKPPIHGKTW